MKAVIYARYSSLGQREQSIEDQIADCRKYADEHGYEVIKIYADYAKSGRNDNRKDFQLMLKESKKKQFDTVLVWKIDRFGRNRQEMAINKAKLKKCGVQVVSCMEYIPDDPSGVILEGMLESIAEYYSLNLGQNVRRGMTSNAKKALCNGPLPWGYKHVGDEIMIDEAPAEIVRFMFDKLLDGYSRSDIVRLLNSKGITTKRGNKFSYASVDNILKNERYTGTYIYDGTVIENAFEPIVSSEDFAMAQQIMSATGFKKHACSEIFYFSGILYCGKCGAHYTSESGTSCNGNKYFYYKCSQRKKKSELCSNDILKKKEFEDTVFEVILNKILNDNIIEELSRRTFEIIENRKSDILPYLESEKAELEKKVANLVKALENGVDADILAEHISENSNQLKKLESEINREKRKSPSVTLQSIEWALKNFKLSLFECNQSKLILVNHFVNSITYTSGIVEINFNFCYMDSKGNIHKMSACSQNKIMARQTEIVLNKIIYHEDGTFSYAFDYASWALAA